MKTYKYSEWFLSWPSGERDTVDNRIYIDNDLKPITGILENFKNYGEQSLKDNPYDTNSVIVRDGKYLGFLKSGYGFLPVWRPSAL